MTDEEIEVLIERLEEDEQGLPSLEAAEALRQLHDKVKAQQARHNAMIDLCNQTDRRYFEAKKRADALEDEVKALREDKRRLDGIEDCLEVRLFEYVDGTKAAVILGSEYTGKTNRDAIDAALSQEDK